MQTLGTPWELETDGAILFFEDTDAPPYFIDGQLTQLRHAGKLDGVQGVVVGDMAAATTATCRVRSPTGARRSRSRTSSTSTWRASACRFSTSCPSGTGSTWLPFRWASGYTLDADERTLTVDESPFQD